MGLKFVSLNNDPFKHVKNIIFNILKTVRKLLVIPQSGTQERRRTIEKISLQVKSPLSRGVVPQVFFMRNRGVFI